MLAPVQHTWNRIEGRFSKEGSNRYSLAVEKLGNSFCRCRKINLDSAWHLDVPIALECLFRLQVELDSIVQPAEAGTDPARHFADPIQVDFDSRPFGGKKECQNRPQKSGQNQAGLEQDEAAKAIPGEDVHWVLGSGLGVGVSDPLRRAAGLAIAYPVRSLSVAGSDELLLANSPGTRRSHFEFPAQPVNPGLSKGISDNLPGIRVCVPLQCCREWIQPLAESGSVVPNVPREESSLLRNKHSEPAKSPPAKRATRENWKVSCLIFNNAAPIQICEKPGLPNPEPRT